MRTRAVRDGDDYVLNGQKIWITNGSVADVVCVFAVTDPEAGSRGVSAFVVEKTRPDFGRQTREKDGDSRLADRRTRLRRLRVPAANRLGEEGEGFKIAMRVLDKSRPGIAAQALGIAAGALDYATNYAKERLAFGKPIGQHQGVGFMLADMKTEVESARLLLYEAARALRRRRSRRDALGGDGKAQVRRRRDVGHHRCRAGSRRVRLFG